MPSTSKAQQKFMGLVHAYKKGEVKGSEVSKAIKNAAKSMKKSSTKKYASTKRKDLPNKVKEEGFGGQLKGKDKLKFEKARKANGEQLGYTLSDTPDVKEDRDYKEEYKKYGSSTKSKKYRAELNQYNRKKGTYGNGDGKDASHKGGKIVGFEKESTNRGRAEKSRLKKESSSEYGKSIEKIANDRKLKSISKKDRALLLKIAKLMKKANEANTKSIGGEELMKFLMKRFKMSKSKAIATMKKHKMDLSFLKKESVNEVDRRAKSQIFSEWNKFEKEYGNFFKAVVKLGKVNTKVTGDKTDEKIFLTDFTRNVGKFYALMQSWVRGQNESVNEYDLGLTYKKGKTVKVKHKKSGKELVIVDKPNVRKEYEKIGFYAESANEGQTQSIGGEELMKYLMKRFKMSKSKAIATMKKHKMDLSFLKKESVNEANPSPAQAGKLFDKLLKKQTKGNLPSQKDIEIVFSLMRKKYGIKKESVNEGPFSGAASVVGGYDDFIIPKNKMSKAKGQYKKMMDYLKMAGKSMTQPGEIDTMVMHMESGYSEMIALWKNVKEVKRESVNESIQLPHGMELGKVFTGHGKSFVKEEVEPTGNMAKIQKIVKDSQATKLGGVMIDMQSANLLMKLWNAVSDKDKEKMNKLNPKVLTRVIEKLWSRVNLRLPI